MACSWSCHWYVVHAPTPSRHALDGQIVTRYARAAAVPKGARETRPLRRAFSRYPEETKPRHEIPVIIDGSVGFRYRCCCCCRSCHDSFLAASKSLPGLFMFEGDDLLGVLSPCNQSLIRFCYHQQTSQVSACLSQLGLSQLGVGCMDWVRGGLQSDR